MMLSDTCVIIPNRFCFCCNLFDVKPFFELIFHVEPSSTHFLWTGPLPYCRQFPPITASLSPSTTQIKEETLLAILLLNTGKLGPQRKTDLVPIHSPFGPPKLHCDHVHRRLLPIRYCSRLSSKYPHNWCCHMDRWLCSLSFGRRKCRYLCGLQKMLILLLTSLLSWNGVTPI